MHLALCHVQGELTLGRAQSLSSLCMGVPHTRLNSASLLEGMLDMYIWTLNCKLKGVIISCICVNFTLILRGGVRGSDGESELGRRN